MATITNNVRWSDNTQELKANLLAGIGTIDAMKASVDRTVASLGGQGLFAAANRTAAAILEMGGANKLTGAEQDRVNTLLDKAIEKYKLMGMVAPPAMVAIANATKDLREKQDFAQASAQQFGAGVTAAMQQAEAPTTLLSGAVGKLSVAFVGMKVLQWGTELFQAAGHLQDLHDRTEISVEALQRFSLIADQNGSSIDAVSTAVFQMGKRIAGGDASAESAVKELGLRFEDIRAMAPEQAFQVLGEAIAALGDPMKQSELGAKIFGKSVAELLAVFKQLKDETGPYIALSGQQVELLDSLGDAYTKVKASIVPAIVHWVDSKFQLSLLNSEIQALRGNLGALPGVHGPATTAVQTWTKAMQDRLAVPVVDGLTHEKDIIADLQKEYDKQQKVLQDAAKAEEAQAKALQAVNDKITALKLGMGGLTPVQQAQILAYEKLGLSVADIALKLKLNEVAVKLVEDADKKATDAAEAMRKELEKIEGTKTDLKMVDLATALQSVGKTVKVDLLPDLSKVEPAFFGIGSSIEKVGLVGKPTMEDLTRLGIDLHDKGVKPLDTALAEVSKDFTQMATIGGDSFGAIARDIGEAIKIVEALNKSLGAVDMLNKPKAEGGGFSVANIAALAASWATVIAGVIQLGEALDKAAAAAENAEYHLNVATLIAQDFFAGVDKQHSTLFTDSLNASLEKTARRLGDVNRAWDTVVGDSHLGFHLAEALNLEEIIKQLGGLGALSAGQLKAVQDRLQDLFTVMQAGGTLAADATKTLDDVLMDMGTHATDSQGLVSQFFLDMVEKAKQAGVVLPQIAALMKQFGQNAQTAFNAVAAGAGHDAQALQDLGIQALATFNAAIASGTSFADALKAADPGLQALKKRMDELGISTDDAGLAELFMQDAILNNNPALLAAVGGLVDESKALFNMGLLNAKTFEAMERTGVDMFHQLQAAAAAAGGGQKEALLPMQQWLHQAADEAKRLNIPLDDMTQEMIDQSKELGIWQEIGPSTQEQMIDATKTLTDKMTDLTDVLKQLVIDDPLGVTATSTAGLNDNLAVTLSLFAQIPNELPDPFRNWSTPSTGPSTGSSSSAMQTSTSASRSSSSQTSSVSRAGITSGDGSLHLEMHFPNAFIVDRDSVTRAVKDHIAPELTQQLRDNRSGVTTQMRSALRIR